MNSTPMEIGERTRRQIAARVLPFLFVLYITNYVDRKSVAYAALGMTGDLGFNDRVFGLVLASSFSAMSHCKFLAPCWWSTGALAA